MPNNIQIIQAKTQEDFRKAKSLVLEYSEWLGIDLTYQNFAREMDEISQTYSEPDGSLFIALLNGEPVGVAGIKRYNAHECELKRMYVRSESRGLGIGKLLLEGCINSARKLNYSSIKLDTANFMASAVKLYTGSGFTEIPAYLYSPFDEARFFELDLKKTSEKEITDFVNNK